MSGSNDSPTQPVPEPQSPVPPRNPNPELTTTSWRGSGDAPNRQRTSVYQKD